MTGERVTLHHRRTVAAAITAYLRPDDADADDRRGAFPKRDTSILIVWGDGLGDFQTLSFMEANAYLRLLMEGREGPPWKLGIR